MVFMLLKNCLRISLSKTAEGTFEGIIQSTLNLTYLKTSLGCITALFCPHNIHKGEFVPLSTYRVSVRNPVTFH